jgi:hypothetical protein
LQVARSSFAPRGDRTIAYAGRHGSVFQIRYFLPGSLSSEPLGTTIIMHRKCGGVNKKTDKIQGFPQGIFALSSIRYSAMTVEGL